MPPLPPSPIPTASQLNATKPGEWKTILIDHITKFMANSQQKKITLPPKLIVEIMIAFVAWDTFDMIDFCKFCIDTDDITRRIDILTVIPISRVFFEKEGIRDAARGLCHHRHVLFSVLKNPLLVLPADARSDSAKYRNYASLKWSLSKKEDLEKQDGTFKVKIGAAHSRLNVMKMLEIHPPHQILSKRHVEEATRTLGTLMVCLKRRHSLHHVKVLKNMVEVANSVHGISRESHTLLDYFKKRRDAMNASPIPCQLLRLSGSVSTPQLAGEDVGCAFWQHVDAKDIWRIVRTCKTMLEWSKQYDLNLKFNLVNAYQSQNSDASFPAQGRDDNGHALVRKDRIVLLKPLWYYDVIRNSEKTMVPVPCGGLVDPSTSFYEFSLVSDETRSVITTRPSEKQSVHRSESEKVQSRDFSHTSKTWFSLSVSVLSSKLPSSSSSSSSKSMRIMATANLSITPQDSRPSPIPPVQFKAFTDPFLCVSRIDSPDTKAGAKRRQKEMLIDASERTKRLRAEAEQAEENAARLE